MSWSTMADSVKLVPVRYAQNAWLCMVHSGGTSGAHQMSRRQRRGRALRIPCVEAMFPVLIGENYALAARLACQAHQSSHAGLPELGRVAVWALVHFAKGC